jgi:hypothetical protein
MYRGASHLSAFNEATEVVLALGRPNDKTIGTTEVLLEWAKANHPALFDRCLTPQAGAATPYVRSKALCVSSAAAITGVGGRAASMATGVLALKAIDSQQQQALWVSRVGTAIKEENSWRSHTT